MRRATPLGFMGAGTKRQERKGNKEGRDCLSRTGGRKKGNSRCFERRVRVLLS